MQPLNRTRSLLSILAFALVAALAAALAAQQPPAQNTQPGQTAGPPPAEQVFKNIQILKGMPAPQVQPAMQFIAASLGVRCDYCHVAQQFEKDDKDKKQVARRMIQMMNAINKDNFEGNRNVNCYTCHRGAARPVSIPTVMQWPSGPPQPGPGGAGPGGPGRDATPLPTPDQILDKFAEALGGRAAAEKLTTRVRTGTLEAPGGFHINVESVSKAPDKIWTVLHTPQGDTFQGYNGSVAWVMPAETKTVRELTGTELARTRRDAQFYGDFDLKKLYANLRVVGSEKIGDRDAYIIRATPEGDAPERLFFDKETGLLVRRVQFNVTPLGNVPLQTDYEDYRDVDGIKRPFAQRQARPDFIFVIRWNEIKNNVPVDDAKFEKPAAPAPAPAAPAKP